MAGNSEDPLESALDYDFDGVLNPNDRDTQAAQDRAKAAHDALSERLQKEVSFLIEVAGDFAARNAGSFFEKAYLAAKEVLKIMFGPAPAPAPAQCFPSGTRILLADGSQETIENIVPGQLVMAFEAHGELAPRRVARLFRNITEEWIELSFEGAREPLVVTPGHRFLTADGTFETIAELLNKGAGAARVVLDDGSLVVARGRIIAYNESSANQFPEASIVESGLSVGGLALAPRTRRGWATYNFEYYGDSALN
jgi:hypothetical protein